MKKIIWQILLIIGFLLTHSLTLFSQININYGDCVEGEIELPDGFDIYAFNGLAGERVIVRARGEISSFSACVEVRNSQNIPVSDVDCSILEGYLDFNLPEDDTYFIIISEQFGDETGSYQLSLQSGFNSPDALLPVCNGTINGSITCKTDMIVYTFVPQSTGNYTFTANGIPSAFSACVEVRNETGEILAQDCSILQAEISLVLEADICHTVLIREQYGDLTGDFSMSILGNCTAGCSLMEICGNGIDDDNNGDTDCEDVACGVISPTASSNAPLTEGQTLQLNAASNNGETYNWTGPNNYSSTAQNPVLSNTTPINSGEYCVVIANANGCTVEQCFDVVVNPASPVNDVTLIGGMVEGTTGQSLMVPIYLEGCPEIASIQGTIEAENSGVIEITGAASAQINVSTFNVSNGAFSWFDMNGGQTIASDEPLFYVMVTLTGAPGDMTDIIFTNNATQIEISCIENGEQTLVNDILFSNGKVTILNSFDVLGEIWTCENSPQAILLSIAIMTGTAPDGTIIDAQYETNMTNSYSFDNVPANSNLTISIEKNTNYNNGISTFYLYAMNQLIIGNTSSVITNPCQIIAADVNCSNSITAADLFAIQQVIVGSETTFPNDCPSWKFIPASHQFPTNFNLQNVFPFPESVNINPLNATQPIDWIGIKMGDIGQNANPQQLLGTDDRNAQPLVFQLPNESYQAGELIALNFTPNQSATLASWQFGLAFDVQKLELVDTKTKLTNLLIGKKQASDGLLRLGWFSQSSNGTYFTNETPVFQLIFRAKTMISKLSNILKIENEGIQAEAINLAGATYSWNPIQLAFKKETEINEIILHQNVPNPFRNATRITFDLPNAMDVNVFITNHLGQVVYTQKGWFEKGQNVIDFNHDNLVSGLYYYSLKTSTEQHFKTMIINQ